MSERNTINILGIDIDNVNMKQAVERIEMFLEGDRTHCIYTPNAEMIMEARRNEEFKKILQQGDMVVADGAGVVLSARILRLPLQEKVSGLDLIGNILSSLSKKSEGKVYLFGSKPGVAEKAALEMKKRYPGITVVGTQDGYNYTDEEVVRKINESGAEILLVGMGVPRQEKWISKYRDSLQVKVCIGCGGSIDIYAGTVKKTPEFLRRNGLEWLFRLINEPSRLKRQLDLPRFMLLTMKTKFTGNH